MKIKQYIKYGLIGLVVCLSACSKMDDTYIDFLKDGEILYLGKVDSLDAHPGKERVELSWTLPSDPKVTRAKIFWNDKADSLEFMFPKPPRESKMDVKIDGLAEGSYSFEIYTYDDLGHVSMKVDTLIRTYGDVYSQSLLGRAINSAIQGADTVLVKWSGAPKGCAGQELIFTDNKGIVQNIFSPASVDSIILRDYVPLSPFQFRTLFLPEPTAIDTFRTAYEVQVVKGPPIELSKADWTATAGIKVLTSGDSYEDYDNRAGANNRPASNAIDGKSNTVWVSRIGTGYDYPHTMLVDMGSATLGAEGFSFLQRTPLNGALKQISIAVSMDNVNWTSLGDFILQNIATEQFIDVSQLPTFRYFKVTGKSDYANSVNLALAEVGVYTR